MNINDTRRIVVGADGSEASVAALRWAVGHAEQIGAEVDVVTGWDVPVTIFLSPTYTDDDYARDAAALLEHTVEKAFAEGPPRVKVRSYLVQNKPALALTQSAQNAELLVVGARGQGELPGVHLGSVAGYCVHHAPCPVLVHRSST